MSVGWKRKIALMVVILMMVAAVPLMASAQPIPQEGIMFVVGQMGYYLDGEFVQGDVAPYLMGDLLMVPVSHVLRELGMEVNWWNSNMKQVEIINGDDVFTMAIGSPYLMKNGVIVEEMVAAPVLMNIGGGLGRAMVPFTALAQALEIEFEWDAEAGTLHFMTAAAEEEEEPAEEPAEEPVVEEEEEEEEAADSVESFVVGTDTSDRIGTKRSRSTPGNGNGNGGDLGDNEMRIAISWTAEELDLDAHMKDENGNHSYYSDTQSGYMLLENDFTSGPATETTIITDLDDPTLYTYYVYSYGNNGFAGDEVVRIYYEGSLLTTINISAASGSTEDNYWHVVSFLSGENMTAGNLTVHNAIVGTEPVSPD